MDILIMGATAFVCSMLGFAASGWAIWAVCKSLVRRIAKDNPRKMLALMFQVISQTGKYPFLRIELDGFPRVIILPTATIAEHLIELEEAQAEERAARERTQRGAVN